MMRASLILIVLLVVGCASSSDRSGSPPRRPGTDTLCYNDCLGSGGNKQFCEDRCSY
jgi:hypothetical protein